MCGIAGLFDSKGEAAIDPALLRRMTDTQSHRGPDDSGFFTAPGIGLGHRRLSIIDLSGGHQPLFNEDHSVVVVYNGEIYNFQDLAKELSAAGHVFRTHCDTEVVVHAWEEWGVDCVRRFRGMFAFALWDANKQTLFLARDRLGIKPLYYAYLPNGTLIFGSEMKALLEHPGLTRRIDPDAVEDYFAYGYVPDPKTIYADVAKLAPGHVLCLRRGETRPAPKAYWDISFEAGRHTLSEGELGEALIEQLREAVRLRLIAEVPLGAFLSGGVDSSAVVALMAGLSEDPVNTCSIGFKQADYDESRYAQQVADLYKTRHRNEIVDADAFDLLDRLAEMYDEPFADSSAIPTFQVSALARKHVTVALSGDGGDELFAGYRRHRWHHYEEQLRGRMPAALRAPLFGTLGRLYPKLDWAPKPLRAKTTFQALARDSADAYFHSVSVMSDELRRKLFSSRMSADLQGYQASQTMRDVMAKAPSDHHLEHIQYADFKMYLPADILTKVDRASMANSLEVRVPILDHVFIEWAARIPTELKIRGQEGKYIFKKALEGRVPDDVLYRPKMGFSIPLANWFRGPLRQRVRDALTGPVLADSGLFDTGFVAHMVERHQSGVSDYSTPIWSLLMFESFLRQVHGGAARQAPSRTLAGAPA
mgnify:CR=1 FL=1